MDAKYILQEMNNLDMTTLSKENKKIINKIIRKAESEKRKIEKESIANATKYAKRVFKTARNNRHKLAKTIDGIFYVTDEHRLVGFYNPLDLPEYERDDWYNPKLVHEYYEFAAASALNAIEKKLPILKLPSVDVIKYAIDKAKESGIKHVGYVIENGPMVNAESVKDALEGMSNVRVYRIPFNENRPEIDGLYFIGDEGFTILMPLAKPAEYTKGFIGL